MALARRCSNLLKPLTAAASSYNPFLRRPIAPSSAAVGIETTPNRDGTGMAESCVSILKKVLVNSFQHAKSDTQTDLLKNPRPSFIHQSEASLTLHRRCFSGMADQVKSDTQDASASVSDVAPRIKFKRPDKTARHIMQILDKEAVEEVKGQREIPDIKPGYIIQLKVEVPDNKRRVSILKGIVIARRNAGLNTTIRLRRLVAGVGIESLFPLYSPNIKEVKVLDKKKVRRAKLYYLRDKMNPLKK